ncbi:MAG: molybdopterin-dependent oxidoreductase [Rhodospirillaceae bacterium]|nr:molybdopterin-dependent oxidoreductase [Rhodospirillaceae bacterium]
MTFQTPLPKPSKTRLSRRTFFVTSAAAGGLVLGARLPRSVASVSDGNAADLNAYVQVMPDNRVSIVVPGAEIGQGVYTTLPKIVAEEMDADWDLVDVRLATANPAFGNPAKEGRQSTGGSDATRGYYDVLRKTGAAAKDMLVRAAAERLDVDAADLSVDRGTITHTKSERSVSFGEVAGAASQLVPLEEPPLKDRADFKLLGKNVTRKDTPVKVDGSADYGADVALEGKLYAALRVSPVYGGEIVSDEREAALTMPGVVAVTNVDGGLAVIAETFWQAKKAAEALDVEWDFKGMDSLNSTDMWQEMRTSLDDEARPFFGTKGDAPAVIADSTSAFEAEYEVPFLAHACMEPIASTALITDSYCQMWSPHQQQDLARDEAANITGLPLENVNLQNTFAGGGFGRKWEPDFARQSVQAAMAVKGRPVSLIWTREQDIQHDFYRAAYVARIRAALDNDGNLIAMHSRLAGESIFQFQNRPRNFPDPTSLGGAIGGSYSIENTLVDYVEYKPVVPVGFWRGVASSQNGFFSESAMDELAYFASKDPYDFRRSLIVDKPREIAVLDKVAEMSGWGRDMPAGRGLGIAFCPGFGSVNAQVAEVDISSGDLEVVKIWCAYDCGFALDPSNVEHQMESGITYALSAAMFGEITLKDGVVEQSNFHDYDAMRLANMPEVEVALLESEEIVGGAGEAAVPATAPAVANAIFAATGQRLRRLPLPTSGYGIA